MAEKIRMAERMAKIETKVENIETVITEIKAMLKDHVDWEATKYSEMDAKYSGKWVEKAIIGISIAVVSGIIVLLIQGI